MSIKKIILPLLMLLAVPMAMMASKAMHRTILVTLADGQQVTASLRGDEHYHCYVTSKGQLLIHDEDGTWHIATTEEQQAATAYQAKAKALRAPQPIDATRPFPHTGTPKALVIVINFTDMEVTHSNEEIYEWLNGTSYHPFDSSEEDHFFSYGSVAQYFNDCSYGLFRPQFDVVGPYTMANGYAYYGKNYNGGDDYTRTSACLKEAINLADTDVDFRQYDSDKDGYVDLVYILYAGYGENACDDENTIWPFSSYSTITTNDGVRTYRYGFSNERLGYPGVEEDMGWSAPKMTGIGVFCHETCHTMGLPDVYPTANWSDVSNYDNQSMEEWDLMDGGENTQSSLYPTPLSAWERSWLGWTKADGSSPLQEITSDGSYTVNCLGIDGNALKLNNPNDSKQNEFYIFETMYRNGWYRFVPGAGLLVTHINYDKSYFSNFTNPNNVQGSPRWTILPANGTMYSSYHLYEYDITAAGDTIYGEKYMDDDQLDDNWKGNVYPGTDSVTTITNWKAYNGTLDWQVTDITYYKGVSTFTLHGLTDGITPAIISRDDTDAAIYTIDGRMVGRDASLLPHGIYIRAGRKFVK